LDILAAQLSGLLADDEELANAAGFSAEETERILEKYNGEPEPAMPDQDEKPDRTVKCNCPGCGFEFEAAA